MSQLWRRAGVGRRGGWARYAGEPEKPLAGQGVLCRPFGTCRLCGLNAGVEAPAYYLASLRDWSCRCIGTVG